ncbi:MAG: hypothetical protein IKS35_06350 [Clostridia bacterium]|nr:hypothetical protein [Clostridia bacterium]
MRLLRAELYKCISAKALWAVLAVLFAACFILTGIHSSASVLDRDVRAVFDWVDRHPQQAEEYREACFAEWLAHRNEEDYRLPSVLSESGRTDDLTLLDAALGERERIQSEMNEPRRQILFAEERLAELEYFGFEPDSYAVRSMEMHKGAYRSVQDQPVDSHRMSFGYDRYLQEQTVPVYAFLFCIVAGAYLFISDRAYGAGPLLQVTRKGGRASALAKASALGIVAMVTGLLFSLCAFLSVGLFCGYSSCLDPVRMVEGCAGVPFPVSILGFLCIHTGMRVMGICVTALIVGCIACVSRSFVVSAVCGAGFVGILEMLLITQSGPVSGLLNPVSVGEATRLLSFFRTLNLFGYPVPVLVLSLILTLILGCLAVMGVLIPNGRRVQTMEAGWIRLVRKHTSTSGPWSRRTAGKTRGNLWTHEAYKMRIPVLLIVLLGLLAAQWVQTRASAKPMQTYSEAVYYRYLQIYNACPDEKGRQTFLSDERQRLDGILALKEDVDERFENGAMSSEEYQDYMLRWRQAYGESIVFSRVEDYIRYLQGQEARRVQSAHAVYSSGYEAYWTQWPDVPAALFWLLIGICSELGNDRFSPGGGLTPLLRTTKKGRLRAELVKAALCAGLGGVGTLMLRVLHLGTVLAANPMESAGQPAWTIPLFGQITIPLSLGGCIALDLILSLLGGALFSLGISRLASRIRSVWITGSLALIVLTLPEMLYGMVFQRAPWLSPLSFVRPSRFFRDIPDPAGTGICMCYLSFWILTLVLACAGSFFTGKGKNRRQKWN